MKEQKENIEKGILSLCRSLIVVSTVLKLRQNSTDWYTPTVLNNASLLIILSLHVFLVKSCYAEGISIGCPCAGKLNLQLSLITQVRSGFILRYKK